VLILASASQSRKKLLENCQIEFIQISSNFDETTIQEDNIFNLALELSFQKANSLFENIQKIYWRNSDLDFNSIDPLLVGLTFVIVGVNAGNLCKADFPKRSVLAGEI